MKCEQFQEQFSSLLNNELAQGDQLELEGHLEGCPACSEELAAMRNVWDMMGVLETPEPSAHMRVKFQAMLNTYKETVDERKSIWQNLNEALNRLFSWQPKFPLAYGLATVLLSFGLSYWMFYAGKGGKQDKQLTELTAQVHELKQTMMLALLENPSASERIKGVSYTSEIKHADQEVIDALLATLNNDPNVNVRLSTLDALAQLANHPEVRAGLIHSILEQDSPLMQSAIADVMLKLQEKRSVKPFRELLKQKSLDPGVKEKIRETITQLI